jgi:hypothetical protein
VNRCSRASAREEAPSVAFGATWITCNNSPGEISPIKNLDHAADEAFTLDEFPWHPAS